MNTVGRNEGEDNITNTEPRSAAEFADGTVLALLKAGERTGTDPWADTCQYVAAAGRTLPVFKGQGDTHTHQSNTWETSETEHWKVCACGAVFNKADHNGGTATCKDKAVCTTCGTAYGEVGTHSFTKETVDAKYLRSAATCTEKAVYYKSCTFCGLSSKGTAEEATFETNALGHDWGEWTSNGDGTHTHVCQNDKSHSETDSCSGGAATCTEKAVCEICGQEYGDYGSHDYSVNWDVDDSEHWHECIRCGSRTDAASHTDENRDHKCDVCRLLISVHTGGTATCAEEAVCEICGQKYGGLVSHDYSAAWATDDSEHWHECVRCGSRTDAAAHTDENKDHKCDTCGQVISAHTGGTATCTDQAVCEICGERYGETDAGNHADLVRVPAKAATTDAEGNIEYWYCEGCHKYYADAAATRDLTQADTVTAKLPNPETPTTPSTGDGGAALWITLLLVSGTLAGMAATKKRKHSKNT